MAFSAGLVQSVDAGANIVAISEAWANLEPEPEVYDVISRIAGRIVAVDIEDADIDYFVVQINTTTTNRRRVPDDLRTLSFDADVMKERFRLLIRSISIMPGSGRISHIIIGDQVDVYLSANADELAAYTEFIESARKAVRDFMPWVRIGFGVNAVSLGTRPDITRSLLEPSDFVAYRYYPLRFAGANLEIKTNSEIAADFDLMASEAGSKQLAFTEIGMASDGLDGTTEELQVAFINALITSVSGLEQQERFAFMFYQSLFDFPIGECTVQGIGPGVSAQQLCGFLGNLGLREYQSGDPKPALTEFQTLIAQWRQSSAQRRNGSD